MPAAGAAVTGYGNNPSGNSSDFSTAVAGNGGAINTSVNFGAHGTGALQSDFYSGVTL